MAESYEKHVDEYGEANTTLDRIDVNWNYCKENCRWATYLEQAENTRINIMRKRKYDILVEHLQKHHPDIKIPLCD